ncbi:MAG: hypothetical protein ACR2NU_14420 [Aeoliella sp.]
MATLGKYQSEHRYIQFENRDRQRKTLRLGKVPKRDAQKIRHHVANMVSAQITGGVPSAETARWLANVSDQLREKLAKVGLCEDRTREPELAEQFPIHVVCEWLGNTQAIAARHYL